MKFQQRRIADLALISALTLFISLNIASSFAVTTPAQCQTANLSLGLGDRISPATGEHGEVYILTNLGKTVCQLRGYPGISLYDSKHRILPFRYIRGAGQWVTHAVPKIVLCLRREIPLRYRDCHGGGYCSRLPTEWHSTTNWPCVG
jgi:hypothetical protein